MRNLLSECAQGYGGRPIIIGNILVVGVVTQPSYVCVCMRIRAYVPLDLTFRKLVRVSLANM